jgi:hypothetical protein
MQTVFSRPKIKAKNVNIILNLVYSLKNPFMEFENDDFVVWLRSQKLRIEAIYEGIAAGEQTIHATNRSFRMSTGVLLGSGQNPGQQ